MASKAQKIFTEQNWFVLSTLVSKDFKLKYRRSILGVLWSLLNPLLMMIILSAVFSYMFRFSIEHFPVYLILGQTLFSFMNDATGSGMSSIIEAAPLIKKIRIAKIIFPIEKVFFALVNFAISLIAVLGVILFFQIPKNSDTNHLIVKLANFFNRAIIFLPLLLLYMLLFCTGLALLLSALAVFFRDFLHLWSVVTTAWMYATPIFYPLSLLPDFLQQAMVANPMFQYITYFRDIMMNGVCPSLETNLICLAMGAITFFVGLVVFKKTERKFILYV